MKAKTRKHRIFGPNCLHPQDWITVKVYCAEFPDSDKRLVSHRNITQILDEKYLRFDKENKDVKRT